MYSLYTPEGSSPGPLENVFALQRQKCPSRELGKSIDGKNTIREVYTPEGSSPGPLENVFADQEQKVVLAQWRDSIDGKNTIREVCTPEGSSPGASRKCLCFPGTKSGTNVSVEIPLVAKTL